MFFGLTIEKLLLIGVIAALLIGPERLPRYAEGLARLTTRAKEMLQGARSRVRDEMGSEFEQQFDYGRRGCFTDVTCPRLVSKAYEHDPCSADRLTNGI